MENKEIRLINLRQLLAESETAASLAFAADTSPSYISQILGPKGKGNIGNRLARRLEAAAGKPKGWLDCIHPSNRRSMGQSQSIPFVAFSQVAQWCQGKRGGVKNQICVFTEGGSKGSQDLFFIEMVGDAMMSTVEMSHSICPGDIVIINQNLQPALGDIVLVNIKNTIKIRRFTQDGDEQIFKALNPHYPVTPLAANMKILGVVVELRRKLRANAK